MKKQRRHVTDQHVNLSFIALQSSYWLAFMPIAGFSVVLLQSKNFTDSEIGILLALQSLTSIIAQPLISSFASARPHIKLKHIVAVMMSIGVCSFSFLHFLPHLFIPAIIIFAVNGMTIMATPAFINAMAMQLAHAGFHVNYGLARGCGSLAFALGGVGLGRLVDLSGESVIIPAFVLIMLIVLVVLLRIKAPSPAVLENKDNPDTDLPVKFTQKNLWAFFRDNKLFTGFCIASTFLFISHSMLNSFLPNIVTNLGGSVTDQGIVRSIAAAVELPIMALYVLVARKVSSSRLLILSSFAFFLKAFATLIVPSVPLFFAAQLFQMFAFGLYTPSAVYFSDDHVDPIERVRAQAVAMVTSFGLGSVIGNLFGGAVLDIFGLKTMLVISSIAAFIGFILMTVVLLPRRHRSQTV